MKQIIKVAVDRIATMLMLRDSGEHEQYEKLVVLALDHVMRWDEPQVVSAYMRKKTRGEKKISEH